MTEEGERLTRFILATKIPICHCGHTAAEHYRARKRKKMLTACKRCLCHGWRPVTGGPHK